MMKNSISRITKRRQGALVRRQDNLKNITHASGNYQGKSEEVLAAKLGSVNADIANLAKKGVR